MGHTLLRWLTLVRGPLSRPHSFEEPYLDSMTVQESATHLLPRSPAPILDCVLPCSYPSPTQRLPTSFSHEHFPVKTPILNTLNTFNPILATASQDLSEHRRRWFLSRTQMMCQALCYVWSLRSESHDAYPIGQPVRDKDA